MKVEYKMNQKNIIDVLFNIQKNHSKKIIMAYVKINCFCKKFDLFPKQLTEYIDILIIYENKLDSTFPHILYHLLNSYRLDRNSCGDKNLVHVYGNT